MLKPKITSWLQCKQRQQYKNFFYFRKFRTLQKQSFADVFRNSSSSIVPEENCPPTLILTLTLNQNLTLTEGQFSGHLSTITNLYRYSNNFLHNFIAGFNTFWKFQISLNLLFYYSFCPLFSPVYLVVIKSPNFR